MTHALVLSAAAANDPTGPPVWITFGLPIATAVIGAILGRAFDALSNAAERRRAGYSEAAAALVAWGEFPYRVRRRTSDDASSLKELATLGHNLQERLARSQMWVASDSAKMSAKYEATVQALKDAVQAPTREAWSSGPVVKAGDMNVEGFPGPDTSMHVTKFREGVKWRFGLRRLVGWMRPPEADPPPLLVVAVPASVDERTAVGAGTHRLEMLRRVALAGTTGLGSDTAPS